MFEITQETSNSSKILTEDALSFLSKFTTAFEDRRKQLLDKREDTQKSIDSGNFMSFPNDTSVRDGDWQVVPPPSDVAQRHVEITGPVDRKMIINALNSGADVFMADFEDSTSPTWDNIIDGHNNLIDANNRDIELIDEAKGKTYSLNPESQTSLFVRPRGLHLLEKNILFEGRPISASIFDFAMYVYHNHQSRLDAGLGIYFYIPKSNCNLLENLFSFYTASNHPRINMLKNREVFIKLNEAEILAEVRFIYPRLTLSLFIGSIGMPLPSSTTVHEPSTPIRTVIVDAKPAMTSSIALSTTSYTIWCKPLPSSVSPMYIPGLLRTASKPLRTLIESAP